MRIITTKFAIGKMIYCIRSPRHRVFTQPGPRADIRHLDCCYAKKTAKALGLEVLPTLLARADEVIE